MDEGVPKRGAILGYPPLLPQWTHTRQSSAFQCGQKVSASLLSSISRPFSWLLNGATMLYYFPSKWTRVKKNPELVLSTATRESKLSIFGPITAIITRGLLLQTSHFREAWGGVGEWGEVGKRHPSKGRNRHGHSRTLFRVCLLPSNKHLHIQKKETGICVSHHCQERWRKPRSQHAIACYGVKSTTVKVQSLNSQGRKTFSWKKEKKNPSQP